MGDERDLAEFLRVVRALNEAVRELTPEVKRLAGELAAMRALVPDAKDPAGRLVDALAPSAAELLRDVAKGWRKPS